MGIVFCFHVGLIEGPGNGGNEERMECLDTVVLRLSLGLTGSGGELMLHPYKSPSTGDLNLSGLE